MSSHPFAVSLPPAIEVGATAAGRRVALEPQAGPAAAAPSLAVAIPLVETAALREGAPPWSEVSVSLCRFAYQRSHEGAMVLESPL